MRPAPLDDYPIYFDQDMDLDEQFKIMLIDLYAGSVNQTNLRDSGTVVDYDLTGYEGAAYFDVYAWNNQSAIGQGISGRTGLSAPAAAGDQHLNTTTTPFFKFQKGLSFHMPVS